MPGAADNIEFDSPANTPVNAWTTGLANGDPGVNFTGTQNYGIAVTWYESPTLEISPSSGGPSLLSLNPASLLDATDWFTGYRPGQVILTFASVPTSGTITVGDYSLNPIGSAVISASLEYIIPLTFTASDLSGIYIEDTGYSATWKLTNINFEVVAAEFWTDFVGTVEMVPSGGVCP